MGLNLNSEDELTSWSLKQTNVSSGSDEEMLESMEDDIRNVKKLIIKRGCGIFDCINCAYIFLQCLQVGGLPKNFETFSHFFILNTV